MKTFEKILVFLVALTFLVWGGYHILRYTNESLELETVFQETVPRSLSGRGIAVRQEIPLGSSSSETPHFLYQDATRVGIGQPIAEYYTGSVKNRNIQEIRNIEQEIKLLKSAQNKNVNNYSSAPIISRDIREQLAMLTQMTSSGECSELENLEKDLGHLVNRRHIATGKGDNFKSRIKELQDELTALKQESDLSNIKTMAAPVSGYFAKNNDGLEEKLNYESMKDFKVDDYLNLIEIDTNDSHTQNGRMVTHSKWYFAVCMPSYQTEWVKPGQSVDMKLSQFAEKVPAIVADVIVENNNNTAVIILASDYISEDIINLRISDVILSFSNFTGLKIDTSNIRFRENEDGETERGVYVLDNYVVRFKTLDVIYEETNFVLSRMNYANSKSKNSKKNVRLFDQIIVEGGNDIYDGKVIQ